MSDQSGRQSDMEQEAERIVRAITACPDGWITWLAMQADEAARARRTDV